jgi:hypothetical protein
MFSVIAMAAVPFMHKEMHKGAGQQNQKGQVLPDMLSVLYQQKVSGSTN